MGEQIITHADGTQAVGLDQATRGNGRHADTPRALKRIRAHQQHLQLMGLQLLDRTVRRPVRELPLRQSFVAHPKALAVIRQNFHGGAPPIAEHEKPATEWIDLKLRRQIRARPSMPARKSMLATATRMRICAVSWITRRPSPIGTTATPSRLPRSAPSQAAVSVRSRSATTARQPLGLTGNAPVSSMNFIGSGFDGRFALPRPGRSHRHSPV
jgi:hypothetical protein